MLGDESRGWAFTRALLGLPARTLHVCGDPAALPLLERVVAETGEGVADVFLSLCWRLDAAGWGVEAAAARVAAGQPGALGLHPAAALQVL